ncbi:Alpha/Beta hydrolase protein [Xylariales sp. AK1849]|nr:Alpha/Beta hydrolase protein [Xylariales sp. AK1849]
MQSLVFLCFSLVAGSVSASPTSRKPCRPATSTSVLTTTSCSSASSSTGSSSIAGPKVDLGYEVHLGTVNETGSYYTFSNVPYAQQPVGALRFQKPIAPIVLSKQVNDGTMTGTMCNQAYPEWIIDFEAAANGIDTATMAAILYAQAGQTESCLLLDVHVPADVFENGLEAEAPVLLWIHGGGFTYGSKSSSGDPAGLVARSKLNGGSGVIVVTINYRLGLFGWLAGPGATPNLGLYDQRMALKWVQKYISRFGGNPDKVTVMGESAGAASILHHITSYGGAGGVPFQKAIPQSPAFEFSIDYEASYQLTLTVAADQITNGSDPATSFESLLMTLDTLDDDDQVSSFFKSVNQAVVVQATTGRFNYGPVVDGTYVPQLPQILLAEGRFHTSLNVMPSHTSNESVAFVPTDIQTEDDVREYVSEALSHASNDTIDYILNVLYPAVFDGTYPWYTQFGRTVQMNTDFYFACSTTYLAKAFNNKTHNYIFAYPPGYHATDVPYVFFNGDTSTLDNGYPVNATLAYKLQDYIVQFAKTGDPNSAALESFPEYGDKGLVLSFARSGLEVEVDDEKNNRCAWIQQAFVTGLLT